MLSFPENPLLKLNRTFVPQIPEREDIEALRRKLLAREADVTNLKAVIASQQERIMNLQFQLRTVSEDKHFASITL